MGSIIQSYQILHSMWYPRHRNLYLFIYLFESDTRSIEKKKNTHNNNNKKRKQAGKKNRTFELHQQLKTMFIIVTLVEEIAIHRIVNIYITRKAAPLYKSIRFLCSASKVGIFAFTCSSLALKLRLSP